MSEHCDVCRALDKAPHEPIPGTPTVSTFDEKGEVDLLFLGDLIAMRAMAVFRGRLDHPARVREILRKRGMRFAADSRPRAAQTFSDG